MGKILDQDIAETWFCIPKFVAKFP